jgi:hypothetical protein
MSEVLDFGDQEVSSRELGNVLGLSRTVINSLVKSRVFQTVPGHGRATYLKLGPSVRSYVQFKANNAGDTENVKDIHEARLRKLRAEAEAKQLLVAQLKRQLFREEDIRQIVGDTFIRVRSKMLAIPSNTTVLITGKTNPVEVKTVLEKAIREVLAEITPYSPEVFAARNPLALPVDPYDDDGGEQGSTTGA